MNFAHRSSRRLFRWTSLVACFAVITTSLAIAPVSFLRPSVSAQSDQSNGKATKVKPDPPDPGPPEFTLPNLDEVSSQRETDPEPPLPISSSLRSKQKPPQSRRGRTVGDFTPKSDGVGALRSSERISIAGASDSIRGKSRIQINKLHHAHKLVSGDHTLAMAALAPVIGDDQYVQNFFTWALVRSPNATEQAYWNDVLRTAYGNPSISQGQSSLLIAMRELGRTLFESAAYAARNRSDHDYVYDLYKAFLMRDPDAQGWSNWETAVPQIGRAGVRRGFEYSTEFANLVATITPNGSASSNAASITSARVDPFNETGDQLAARDCAWGLPLLSLPGRGGLDLGLGVSYSSLVFTRSGPYLYFDEDNSSLSPGFRVGFATIQGPVFDAQTAKNVYLLITSSGRRVDLRQIGTSNVYEAGDSSYLQLTDNGDLTVRTTDGTQMTYGWFEYEWRVTQVKDRNGNYLTINNDWRGDIQDITDTLGRVIDFNYDANANLLSITQSWNGVTHTWATFGWGAALTMNVASFTGASVVGTYTGESIPVLRQVGLDDGSYYTLDYTAAGQVNMIRRKTSDNVERSHTAYDYGSVNNDCPRITQTRVSADNWTGLNGVPAEVTTGFDLPGDGSHRTTAPDGTIYKEFYGTGWQNGLVTQSEVWSGGVRQKWTTTAYTQDNITVDYQTNPRVTETNVYDASGNRRRTTIAYTTYSLPADIYEYAANAATVLRRNHTDYNLTTTYTNRRIIGLPSAQYLCDGAQGAVPCSNSSGASLLAKSTFQYDETGSVQFQSSPVQHDDTSYGSSFVAGRGNLSSVRRYNVSNLAQYTTNSAKYNTAGSTISATDALNHVSTITYADSFSDGNNGRNTYAYPTTVTDADGFQSLVQYNFDYGARTRVQGPPPQGQPQGVIQTITYDSAQRVTRVTTTNTSAYTRYIYGPNYVQTWSTVNSVADQAYAINVFDGAGRTIGAARNHPGSTGGYSLVNTIYDAMGRAIKQSNPTEVNVSWVPTGDDSGATSSALPVVWTNDVGVYLSGNTLTKSAATAWGNAGASSTLSIASGDGYVETTAGETNKYRMIGLSKGDSNQNYPEIDFAIYLTSTGTLMVYEGGASRGSFGTYATGDVLRVAVEGGAVKYRKNGALLYTSAVAPAYPLLVDSALYTTGSTLNNVMIYGAFGGSGGMVYTQQTYDWKGRPLVTTNTDGTQHSASYAGCGCAGGEVVTLTDELGRQQKIYSDPLGRQWKTEVLNWDDTVYSTTTNTLNVRDQVSLVRQTDNATSVYQDTAMVYDGYARLSFKHLPDQNAGTNTVYAYNNDDTIQRVTDARGSYATYSYNNRHLVTSIAYQPAAGVPDTHDVGFQYDAAGNRTSMTDGFGSKSYTYNQLSQLMSETRTFNDPGNASINGVIKALSYDYNLAGELKKITDPTNMIINYAFDNAGRVTGVTGSGTLYAGVSSYASNFKYRAWNAAKHLNYGNTLTLDLSYNNRLQASEYDLKASGGAFVMGQQYFYYDDGRVASSNDLTNSNLNREYGYDQKGRLVSGTTADISLYGPYSQTYGYDAWDNMNNRSWRTFYYNQYCSCMAPTTNYSSSNYANNRNTATGWSYDADGRLLGSSDSGINLSYSFDAASQLIASTGPGRTIGQGLDGDGLRTKWVENNVTTYHVRSSALGGQTIVELDQYGNKLRGYVYGGGQELAKQEAGQVLWDQRDVSGVSMRLTDSTGAVSSRIETDPLGTQVSDNSEFNYNGGGSGYGFNPNGFYGDPTNPNTGCSLGSVQMSCSYAQHLIEVGGYDRRELVVGNPWSLQNMLGRIGDPLIAINGNTEYYVTPSDPKGPDPFAPDAARERSLALQNHNLAILGLLWVGDRGSGEGGSETGTFFGPQNTYDPRADFRDYARQLINAPPASRNDCMSLALLVYKAGQVTSGDADRTVSTLLNQLTEWSSVTGSTMSDPNYRVGIGRPSTSLGWGQNGFHPDFKDRDPNSANQVRHFAYYFAAGYQSIVMAATGLYLNEGSIRYTNADVALGEAAINLGDNFTGDYRKLAQDVWHQVCGEQSNLNLP